MGSWRPEKAAESANHHRGGQRRKRSRTLLDHLVPAGGGRGTKGEEQPLQRLRGMEKYRVFREITCLFAEVLGRKKYEVRLGSSEGLLLRSLIAPYKNLSWFCVLWFCGIFLANP